MYIPSHQGKVADGRSRTCLTRVVVQTMTATLSGASPQTGVIRSFALVSALVAHGRLIPEWESLTTEHQTGFPTEVIKRVKPVAGD